MEVKIGVQFGARELTIDVAEDSDAIEKAVSEALSDDSGLLSLQDTKGRRVLVPTARLSYVELGSPTGGQVGFRS
jgi:hypothetical protein